MSMYKTLKELRKRNVIWSKYFGKTKKELAELFKIDDVANKAVVGDWLMLVKIATQQNKNAAAAWRILDVANPELASVAKSGSGIALACKLGSTYNKVSRVLCEV